MSELSQLKNLRLFSDGDPLVPVRRRPFEGRNPHSRRLRTTFGPGKGGQGEAEPEKGQLPGPDRADRGRDRALLLGSRMVFPDSAGRRREGQVPAHARQEQLRLPPQRDFRHGSG